MPGDQSPTQYCHPLRVAITQLNMTALNLRKNTAQFLLSTASFIEQAKVPNKEDIGEKLNEYRTRAAALMMPNDMAFVITPKTEV